MISLWKLLAPNLTHKIHTGMLQEKKITKSEEVSGDYTVNSTGLNIQSQSKLTHH